jgi:hypothetical protein
MGFAFAAAILNVNLYLPGGSIDASVNASICRRATVVFGGVPAGILQCGFDGSQIARMSQKAPIFGEIPSSIAPDQSDGRFAHLIFRGRKVEGSSNVPSRASLASRDAYTCTLSEL